MFGTVARQNLLTMWKTVNDEYWKQIKNTNYEVSNYGRVKNTITNFILKQAIDKYGYPKIHIVDINKNNMYKTIHRLVAETLLPNINNLPQVNHKDGNKLNNHITNLEWVTVKENIIHSFDNLLNSNTIPLCVKNILTNEIKYFRSIKDLSRFFKSYTSAIIPLIKNSPNNPIFGKFIVIVNDESFMSSTFNSDYFGRHIYVYDTITDIFNEYSSILLASYFTGIRSLSNINTNITNGIWEKIGYVISFDKKLINKNISLNKEIDLNIRNRYLNKPYKKHSSVYYLYDYYTKTELCFKSHDDIYYYLNNIDLVSKQTIATAICNSNKNNKSWLIRGLGICSDQNKTEWFPYTEEIILCSKYKINFSTRTYKVTIGNNDKIIFGIYNLCNYLNYSSDKLLRNITIDEIIQSSNIPKLSIRRLDSPVE